MKKGNDSNVEQGAFAALVEEVDGQATNAPQAAQQPPSCLLACTSTDDLARYLHTLGWRGTLDPEWSKLATLWTEIFNLRCLLWTKNAELGELRGKKNPPVKQDDTGEYQ